MRGSSTHVHVRELLRHLDEPQRLTRNPIAVRWRSMGADVRASVEQAILELPEIHRTIIVRCDLAKELHQLVALDLGIGLRHFYRRRHEAFKQLELLFSSVNVFRPLLAGEDPAGAYLAHATVLQNAGRLDAAIDVLERVQANASDRSHRIRVACRLVDLYCAAGLPAAGRRHLEMARALSSDAPFTSVDQNVAESSIEAAGIRLGWHCRDLETLQGRAGRVVRRLQGLMRSPAHQRVAEELVSTLLVLVEVKRDKGAFGQALTDATEATSVLNHSDIMNPTLQLRCMTAVASLRYYVNGYLADTIEGLNLAYAYAQEYALPREAAGIAGNLCGALAIRGEVERALQFAQVAITTCKSVCSSEEVVRTSLEVAAVYLMCNDLRSARSLLSNARTRIGGGDNYLFGMACLLDADILLVEKSYYRALSVAQKARCVMERIGFNRFRGSALRIEAEAQEHLGNRRAAIRDIDESLHLLQLSGHPYILARAYDCSARVRIRRSDELAANDLTRMLRT